MKQLAYLAAALGGWGCDVVTASSSAEALDACRRRPLQAAFVDRGVVAADLRLPDAGRCIR